MGMKIAVIGAGIGGLTAAIALARQGMAVEVYEQAPALEEVGAGVGLWPNAMAALELIGLSGPVARLSAKVDRQGLMRPDGSWLLNPPARDRHATYDAVFCLRQLGKGNPECKKSMEKAVGWVLSCRNPDGGFGHYPGSPSDADAVYFHVGVLFMAGFLTPAEPMPADPQLLSWGHLMPLP